MLAWLALGGASLPFDPVAFFKGNTRGAGTLRQLFKSPKKVAVTSVGSVARDGTLILRQHIDVQDDKPRDRVWRLKQTGPTTFAGTLSDAKGPVSVAVVGSSFRIRYRSADGLSVEQFLTPTAGGRAIDNKMTFSKLGLRVATLTERIEKR